MKKLACLVDDEVYKKFSERAYSMGLKKASHLRSVVKASLTRKKCTLDLTDIQRSIIALIPAIAEAFGIVHRIRPDQTTKLAKLLLEVWQDKRYIPSSPEQPRSFGPARPQYNQSGTKTRNIPSIQLNNE